VLSGEPVSTSLRRPDLGAITSTAARMRSIRWAEGLCNADKASKTLSATVASVAGATVTLGRLERRVRRGQVPRRAVRMGEPDGLTDRRTILRVTGNTLSLSGIAKDVDPAATPSSVVLGCNHKAYAEDGGDCQPLHDNILNYGGDRWIPLKNPIGDYNNYF
jgi:hypothetical protein